MAARSLFISNSYSPSIFSRRKHSPSSKSCLPQYPNAIPFSSFSSCLNNHKFHYFSKPKISSLRSIHFHKNFLAPPVKGVGSSSFLDIQDESSSAAAIVDSLYAAINRKDVDLLGSLLAEGCILNCMLFFQPFGGKQEVVGFMKDFMEAMAPGILFVIDDIIEGNSHKVTVMWHLEWNQIKLPFSKGCSFHICESYEGKLLISDTQVFTESPIKLGFPALGFMKILAKVLEPFPFLATEMQQFANPKYQFLLVSTFSLLVFGCLIHFIVKIKLKVMN